MPTNPHDGNDKWLRSDDVRKLLRLSTCDLAHLRQAGRIAFRKTGNAYLYSAADCARLAKIDRGAATDSADGSGADACER